MRPLAIAASGMVTGVGLNAPSTCAAIRSAINSFAETRFLDRGGEWIIGSRVPLEPRRGGLDWLVHMVAPAIEDCLSQAAGLDAASIPLLLCVAETERPGRLSGLEDDLFRRVSMELGQRFHSLSALVPLGRVAGAMALTHALHLLYTEHVPACLIAGVDSLLYAPTLSAYEERRRLLTSRNADGFIPGEAAAAILVTRPRGGSKVELICFGIGIGKETATIESEQPLRGDGLVQAFRQVSAESGRSLGAASYRITDCNGEQYWFKEAALAITRVLRERKEEFLMWHAADCLGETGAAAGPIALAIALAAARKGYAPGPGLLCHFGSDNGVRIALLLGYEALDET